MNVFLVDGTYELFRHYFAVPRTSDVEGNEVGAVRGVVGSMLSLLEDGVTHIGVATDHVVESFRNQLWDGYKTGRGVEPELLQQFQPLEEALEALRFRAAPAVLHAHRVPQHRAGEDGSVLVPPARRWPPAPHAPRESNAYGRIRTYSYGAGFPSRIAPYLSHRSRTRLRSTDPTL